MSCPCYTHQHSRAGADFACSSGAPSPTQFAALDQFGWVVPAVQLDCFLSQIINPQVAQHLQVAQQSVHLRGVGFQGQNGVSGSLQGRGTAGSSGNGSRSWWWQAHMLLAVLQRQDGVCGSKAIMQLARHVRRLMVL